MKKKTAGSNGKRKLTEAQLQKRIEMVVKKARKREGKTDYDVIRHVNAPLRFTNAHKIG